MTERKVFGWSKTGIRDAMAVVRAEGQQATFSFAKDYVCISPGKKGLTLVYRREVKGRAIYSKFARIKLDEVITDDALALLSQKYNEIHFPIEEGDRFRVTPKKITLDRAMKKYMADRDLKPKSIKLWSLVHRLYIPDEWLRADVHDFGKTIPRDEIVSWFHRLSVERGRYRQIRPGRLSRLH